jgi:hypothetical protein
VSATGRAVLHPSPEAEAEHPHSVLSPDLLAAGAGIHTQYAEGSTGLHSCHSHSGQFHSPPDFSIYRARGADYTSAGGRRVERIIYKSMALRQRLPALHWGVPAVSAVTEKRGISGGTVGVLRARWTSSAHGGWGVGGVGGSRGAGAWEAQPGRAIWSDGAARRVGVLAANFSVERGLPKEEVAALSHSPSATALRAAQAEHQAAEIEPVRAA